MGRTPESRTRVGEHEEKLLDKIRRRIRSFPLAVGRSAERETVFNAELLGHLRADGIDIENSKIPSITILGETFRPEGYVDEGKARPLCCLECKRMLDHNAKAVWKEGLAQSLLYAIDYKHVYFIIYDFTASGLAEREFGPGNKSASSLARRLREEERIDIVVIRAS